MASSAAEIGLILDCDGVLLDSMGAWEQAEYAVCDTVGVVPTKEDIDLVNTMTLMEACEYYFKKYRSAGSVEATCRIIDESMFEFYRTQVPAEPGALEFVSALHEQGVRTCVVSSSPLRYLQAGLGKCGFLSYLDGVLSADELGTTKRENFIFDKALEILGTDKANTWGFDDTAYALRTVSGAGCRTVGIYSSDSNATVTALQDAAEFAYRGGLAELGADGFLKLALD